MRQRSIAWFIVCLLIFTIGFISGCSSKTDKVPIVYAHPPCPPDLLEIYNRIFEKFRKTHPDIDLKVLYLPRDYESKILAMFAGNTAPDVIFMYPKALPTWVSKNALREIESFIKEDSDFNINDYYPDMLRSFTYKGHLYGLPKDASAQILFYNKEMFIRDGVEFPNVSWTWDSFLESARRFAEWDAMGRVIRYGSSPYPLFDLIWQNGGRVFSDDGKTCLLDRPEVIEAIQFMADMILKYQVTPSPQVVIDVGLYELFGMGKMAMLMSMYPVVSVLRERCKFDWDIALLPKGRVKRASLAAGSAFAITTQSKHSKEAWEWIKWMTGAGGMGDLAKVESPSYIPLARSSQFLDPDLLPQNKQVAIDVMNYVYPPPQSARWVEMESIINRDLDLVWYGNKNAEEVCKGLAATYKTNFSD